MQLRILLTLIFATTSAFSQVVQESSKSLGRGFKEVTRSKVNPPGHWEGIGHFAYVYYKETPLGQCSASDLFIAPSGKFAIYVKSEAGIVTLFETKNRKFTSLTKGFVALIDRVDWNEKGGSATVYFTRTEDGKSTPPPLLVHL